MQHHQYLSKASKLCENSYFFQIKVNIMQAYMLPQLVFLKARKKSPYKVLTWKKPLYFPFNLWTLCAIFQVRSWLQSPWPSPDLHMLYREAKKFVLNLQVSYKSFFYHKSLPAHHKFQLILRNFVLARIFKSFK